MDNFHDISPDGRARARGVGFHFDGTPGTYNSITDVEGLEFGLKTIVRGTSIRTGVTAIHPRGRNGLADPVAAGFHSQNGNGEMTGVSWIRESGTFSGPIVLTNTHSVGIAHAGVISWTVKHHPDVAKVWLLPVVGETWDGYLNDINSHPIEESDIIECLEAADTGPVLEGSVGGGTGMNCYEFKGGNGTSSRLVNYGSRQFTVGAFVQANFGTREELTIAGVPFGKIFATDNPMRASVVMPPGAGSCIGLVATDAPLLPDQCRALARRVSLGLARTGTTGSHFSGDLFLAFSTANVGAFTPGGVTFFGAANAKIDQLDFLPWGNLDPLYEAVVQAVEEAVVNALVVNQEMIGHLGHRSPGFPASRVREHLETMGSAQ
ncbi:MAG: P1 family peptidase [Gammaproteobacteria bacterium]|jgi:L-aminopeptidase/D-esterase-like protein|uniref:DmpA family aminopeptidase n=1 Tax=Ferrimicrobium acidiphilum TaxID=121039 RepID=UPI0023F2CB5E|nr:P1 family peptidase [Ferrimicrobium acidiphilum]MCL5052290.1 P1 family peptidase [Gammaproteobacteria bacterium]